MNISHKILLFFLVLGISATVAAQTRGNQEIILDPRGEPEVTICSQNLKNYAPTALQLKSLGGKKTAPATEKESALVSRFMSAGCDIVGMQEVNGTNDEVAKQGLNRLAYFWQKRSGRVFDVTIGAVNENTQHLGFLVAQDKAEILNTISYRRVLLPKIDDNQKPRQFTRAPVEVQLSVKGKEPKNISIILFHFKSKSGSMGDPVGLEWETARMEMAEAVRKIALERYKSTFETGDVPLIVMGDRNSNFDSASAQILEGSLELKEFKGKALCRMSKRGVPLCQAGAVKPRQLFSVLTSDPQTKLLHGTFVYKKVYSWIDDILLPQSVLPMARISSALEGDYDSGVITEFPDASDHALVYVRLNY